jgi:hypothetical protein
MPPGEPEANIEVINRLLDLVFYRQILLRKPRNFWKPYQELAIKIEKGVSDLRTLAVQANLETQLGVSSKMVGVVNEILQKGTFDALTRTQRELDMLISSP